MFVGGFTQKPIKEGLFIKANHVYPQQNRCGKTLEDSRVVVDSVDVVSRLEATFVCLMPYG